MPSYFKGIDSQFRYESYAAYRTYKEEVSGLLSQMENDGARSSRRTTAERSKNEAIGFGYNGITNTAPPTTGA
jgi:uncharacterized membrane protein YfhO